MVTKQRRAVWGIAEAKARLSEVIEYAAKEPQVIKRRGKAVGVLIDVSQFAETQRLAVAGSAAERMQAFLEASAVIRRQGGVDLPIAKRETRKSPFARS